jgi:hypothetical protein
LQTAFATPLTATNQKWAYPPNSREFLEVHSFAHSQKIITLFQDMLYEFYKKGNPLGASGGSTYQTSLPAALYSKKAHVNDLQLQIFSSCLEANTAYYVPAYNYLCLGTEPTLKNFGFAQDPDVIYHELGHSFVQISINLRNRSSSTSYASLADLGYVTYDEAGALNEGIADYFSYVGGGGKTHFAEWGVGRFFKASRPLIETDPIHAPGISRDDDARLSYPYYLSYDPNFPNESLEDIHYAGQILSHFYVALTEELQTYCRYDLTTAMKVVLQATVETLSELGDLTSRGSAYPPNVPVGVGIHDRINFTETNTLGALISNDWIRTVNPITFRSYFQTFSRFMYLYFWSASPILTCTGNGYTKNYYEKLLDKYGLLLFKTYNNNLNGIKSGHLGTLVQVNPANRLRTNLIKKKYLREHIDETKPKAIIFDEQVTIRDFLAALKEQGRVLPHDVGTNDTLPFNNNNGRISPGELIGLSLNLYNHSNSLMGGIQVLGNDWDHGRLESGYLKPCNNFQDKFPASTNDGAASSGSSSTVGDCEYITRTNGSATEPLMPICFVQMNGETETKWVSQEYYRKVVMKLPDHQCLIDRSLSNGSHHDCLIRVIPGADTAYYSKMAPHKTWAETYATADKAPTFNSNHLILLEVNKKVPPGTSFNCRFRARFTNCDDCWSDPTLNVSGNTSEYQDDFLDYEYAGATPFQIFNLQFSVID